MQRLARSHANCLEGLPLLGGLMLVATVAGRTTVTDPLAYVLLFARILQSVIHLSVVSTPAVMHRLIAFLVQLGMALYWAFDLLVVWVTTKGPPCDAKC